MKLTQDFNHFIKIVNNHYSVNGSYDPVLKKNDNGDHSLEASQNFEIIDVMYLQ